MVEILGESDAEVVKLALAHHGLCGACGDAGGLNSAHYGTLVVIVPDKEKSWGKDTSRCNFKALVRNGFQLSKANSSSKAQIQIKICYKLKQKTTEI